MKKRKEACPKCPCCGRRINGKKIEVDPKQITFDEFLRDSEKNTNTEKILHKGSADIWKF